MIYRCPTHGTKLRITIGWQPPKGLDPKMRRYTCMDCIQAYYKAPKHCLMTADQVQLTFGISVNPNHYN